MLAGLAVVSGLLATPVHGIPVFARKYKVTCALCHDPFPRLNAFGEAFAGNGFEMAVGEAPNDTLDTGDALLRLQQFLPLAMRVDAYLASIAESGEGVVANDLQTPFGIKLLSGGQITDRVSYYFYFYMSERGEVAGLEDAYVQFTDLFGSGLSVIAGQFQISDPLYKRELRLEYEDYQPYRIRLGEARADLTYDRGLMALYSPWEGGDITLQIVNGRGLSEATAERRYDRDNRKNVGIRYSQVVGPLRLGGFVYLGEERSEGIADDIVVWGPDATVSLGGAAELNIQYLRRTDENPFFLSECAAGDARCDLGAADPFETSADAVLAELLYFLPGSGGRWVVSGLFNWIDADRQALSLRLGEQEDAVPYLDRYQTFAVGASYLWRRNLRAMGEAQWDVEREQARFTVGVVAGF